MITLGSRLDTGPADIDAAAVSYSDNARRRSEKSSSGVHDVAETRSAGRSNRKSAVVEWIDVEEVVNGVETSLPFVKTGGKNESNGREENDGNRMNSCCSNQWDEQREDEHDGLDVLRNLSVS